MDSKRSSLNEKAFLKMKNIIVSRGYLPRDVDTSIVDRSVTFARFGQLDILAQIIYR